MFERPQSGDRAVLVYVGFSTHLEQDSIEEFRELAASAGVEVVSTVVNRRNKPNPRYLISESKVEDVAQCIAQCEANLVLVDFELTPGQERNLEQKLCCRVIDRTGLILDIFAQRASSHEGRLQVELAQLQHLSTRLIRGWTHLERQKGGIGLRGPGETQLETDRRLIGGRIKQLKKRLAKVKNRRGQSRRSRQKAEVETVSLVGYTNAGKSTLFNKLTHSDVYAQDQLFATLDPTIRRLELQNNRSIVLADTVGFIRQLPHDLVEAFHSTLEEISESSLILHIIDTSQSDYRDYIEHVDNVLKQIGAHNVPQIHVYNKIDQLEHGEAKYETGSAPLVAKVWLSATTGAGIDNLLTVLSDFFQPDMINDWLCIPANAGKLRAMLFEHGQVLQECVTDDGRILLQIEIDKKCLKSIEQKTGFDTGLAMGKLASNYCG